MLLNIYNFTMMKQEHNKTKNGLNNGLQIKIQLLKSLTLPENLTILDLSGRQLERIEIDVLLPNLINLNLSHNNLKEVPGVVLRLNKLKTFDLSFNSIELFDDEPAFCDSIELLNVSNNALIGPPYWIWSKSTGNLHHLNLSNNRFLLTSLKNEYLEEFLTYSLSVTEIHLQNCGLKDTSSKILSTLQRAKKLTLGSLDYNYLSTNHLIELPCEGLDTLCDIESLNVCNSHIYTVNCNISIYKNLIEIDLSDNWIHSLPNEFSLLKNLEICTLSKNKLLYLPENIQELVKLKALYLNCNELCMIEENLCKLHCLSILDLYDNFITGVPEDLKEKLEAIDLAQNYFDEPEDICYVDKKQKLRLNKEPRNNGRKIEVNELNSEHSPDTTDDEGFLLSLKESSNATQTFEYSSEDWDSDNDDYWIPYPMANYNRPKLSYISYIRMKMKEGNFCPIDLHTPSVSTLLSCDMKNSPAECYETEGQFSD